MPKIILATDNEYFLLEEIFQIAKEDSFDGVDYDSHMIDLFRFPLHVKELSKKYQTPIVSMHQPLLLGLYAPRMLFKRMLGLASFLGKNVITNNHLSGFLTPIHRSSAVVTSYVSLAKAQGVIPVFESNPRRDILPYPGATSHPLAYSKFCKEKNLSMTFDTSHIASFNYDIVDFFRENHQSITLIHLSDFAHGVEHLPLGQGALPIAALLREIKRVKWNSVIAFEIFSFPKIVSKKDKRIALQKSLQMVRNYLA